MKTLLVSVYVAASLATNIVRPAFAQTLSAEKMGAVMVVINSLLLGQCKDEDKDRLCDEDELKYFGDLSQLAQAADGAAWDYDGDGLSNGDELNQFHSNPDAINTDGDLLGDFAESLIGTSLTVAFTSGATLGSNTALDKSLLHKLNRLTFGPTQVEFDQVSEAGGIDAWIAEQLIPIDLPPAPPRQDTSTAVAPLYDNDIYPFPYDCTGYTTPDPAQAMRDCYTVRRDDDAGIMGAIRPMHSTRQLQARLAMFWDNHFNTDLSSHGRGMQELLDEDNWFINAFGNFRILLELDAKNYTMLEYLDLDDNRKYSPNENFPREILELHSVGIDGGYTATDIAQLAYILTGWDHEDVRNIDGLCSNSADVISCAPYVSRYAYQRAANNDTGGTGETGLDESAYFEPLRVFMYKSSDHDDGARDYDGDGVTNLSKTLYVGTTNEITISSRGESEGQQEGEEALTFLAEHPATADFICTKLAQEFISDVPEAITISNCAAVFLANAAAADQMGKVLENLLNSVEFNAPSTQRGKLKDSQEVVFSLGRLLGWDAREGSYTSYCPSRQKNIAAVMRCVDQRIFYKAEPTGYYESADNWQDTNIALNRFREMNMMVTAEDLTRSFVSYFNALGLQSSGEIMAHLFLVMLGGNYDEHDVQLATNILHKADPDDSNEPRLVAFDLNSTDDYLRYDLSSRSSGNANQIPDPEDRLRALIVRLAALPEFQLH